MTASVLRGLVETALAELQAFFEIYSDAAAQDQPKAGRKAVPPSDDDIVSTSSSRIGRQSGQDDDGGDGGDDGVSASSSSSSGGDEGEQSAPIQAEKTSLELSCPPAFKVIILYL